MDDRLEAQIATDNKYYLDKFIGERKEPYRHFEYDHSKKTVVCKHYLMDRCFRDDDCQYAHEIVPALMPDCKFYADCTDYFCHFKHQDDEELKKGCLDFYRGIELGECKCARKGDVARMCPNYAAGFCPLGPKCPYRHPMYDQPINRTEIATQVVAPCIKCGKFHLAHPRGNKNVEQDVWVNNSCSVRFKCRQDHPERIQERIQQYFSLKKNELIDLAYEVIDEIRQDELRRRKQRK